MHVNDYKDGKIIDYLLCAALWVFGLFILWGTRKLKISKTKQSRAQNLTGFVDEMTSLFILYDSS
jgi:hypothetical protein